MNGRRRPNAPIPEALFCFEQAPPPEPDTLGDDVGYGSEPEEDDDTLQESSASDSEAEEDFGSEDEEDEDEEDLEWLVENWEKPGLFPNCVALFEHLNQNAPEPYKKRQLVKCPKDVRMRELDRLTAYVHARGEEFLFGWGAGPLTEVAPALFGKNSS